MKNKIPATAYLIGFVSLFSDVSTEMAYPLLPLFISEVLGAKPVLMGLIEGIAEATASAVKGFSGWISDWLGQRKKITVFGYGLTAFSKPIVAIATVWPTVLLGRFFDRLGKGIRSAPKDALLADLVIPEERGRIFGFERAMDSAGAVIGPLLALLLLYWGNLELRTLLFLTTIPAFISLLLISFIPEIKPTNRVKKSFRLKELSSNFWLFVAVNSLFEVGNSTNAFLLLKARSTGMQEHLILACYILYNFIYSAGSYPAGTISDKVGRKNVLIVGYVVFALSYLGFAIVPASTWTIFLLFALYGIYPALTDGVGKALAADSAEKELRATAIGIFSAFVGLSRLFASIVAGILWDSYGSRATFLYSVLTSVVATTVFAIFFKQKTSSS
ncbi:MAG: MFS transporter [Blastocatellia bacterium]|nr:MFS transporter [Blastocatellia bacterium]